MNLNSFFPASRSKGGFTLVELVLVLTILAVLMGGAIYQMNRSGFFEQAADDTIIRSIENISTALDSYRNDAGRYPTTEQGLKALVEKPTTGTVPDRWHQFMKKVPEDPWGQPYEYAYPAAKSKDPYDVFSIGKDGQKGTADDIGNWSQAPAAK